MSKVSKRIYLSSPHMSGREKRYINEAFDSNWIAPLGPNVDAFEKALAEYCEVGYVAALSSGTAALHLSLIMLGVKAGDEVLVSTFTFSASVNPIVYQGAKPIFIDSEEDTWNMDPELLEQALKERRAKGTEHRVKAIIVVHLYGMPAKMDEIMEIANRYDIPVIEDAAEALGSKYKDKHVGSFGKLAFLSFNGNKIINTSGGGAILSNDKNKIEKAWFLASQARDQAPHYQHSEIGYNYRLSNVLAGIGRGQMEVIDERVSQKREIYRYYYDNLSSIEGIEFLKEPSKEFYSNRWLTTILVNPEKSKLDRNYIQVELEKHNIETRPLWKPMHMQPVFSSYSSCVNNTAESLFAKGLCLPSGSSMTESDKLRIIDILLSLFKGK